MDNGPSPGSILPIYKPNFAAMGAGDLLCESEADTAAFGLGGIEGDKEVFSVGNAKAAVFDADNHIRLRDAPSDTNRLGAVGQRCVDRVGEQVDKHLFK